MASSSKITRVLNLFSGLQITYQSCDSSNDVSGRHHFTSDIPGTNFNFIRYLELEILERGVYTPVYAYCSRKKVYARRVKETRTFRASYQPTMEPIFDLGPTYEVTLFNKDHCIICQERSKDNFEIEKTLKTEKHTEKHTSLHKRITATSPYVIDEISYHCKC